MIAAVRSTGNDDGVIGRDALTEWAGYLLAAPLAACLAVVVLPPAGSLQELAQRGAVAWGAALLAGSGGVHLGVALAGGLAGPVAAVLAGTLATALIAAVACLLGGQHALALLVVATGGFWLYERRHFGTQLPPAYLELRRHTTLASCALLAVLLCASAAAGLS